MNKKILVTFGLVLVLTLAFNVSQAQAFGWKDFWAFLGFGKGATTTTITKPKATTPPGQVKKPATATSTKPTTPVGNSNKITPEALATGKIGAAYNMKLLFHHQTNETNPSWTIVKGALPAGLILKTTNFNEGTISGTPTKTGTYYFTVRASTKTGVTSQRDYNIVVNQNEVAAGKVQVLYPNGGETIKIGDSLNILWANDYCKQDVCPGVNPSYSIKLIGTSEYLLARDAHGKSFSWSGVTESLGQEVAAGTYQLEICGSIGGCDKSDKTFTLTR